MRHFPVSALVLATAALAQDPLVIHVGNGAQDLLFSPSSVTASIGTVITFVFDSPSSNYIVAQSSFVKPCEPLVGGFDSGYTRIPADASDPPAIWNLTITDTKPIWFYCAQDGAKPSHCTAGMVGAINAPASPQINFDAFRSAANRASTVVQPTFAPSGVGAVTSTPPSSTIFVPNTSVSDSASAYVFAGASGPGAPRPSISPRSSTSDRDYAAPPPNLRALALAARDTSTLSSGSSSSSSEAPPVSTTAYLTINTTTLNPPAKSNAASRLGSVAFGRSELMCAIAAAAFTVALL